MKTQDTFPDEDGPAVFGEPGCSIFTRTEGRLEASERCQWLGTSVILHEVFWCHKHIIYMNIYIYIPNNEYIYIYEYMKNIYNVVQLVFFQDRLARTLQGNLGMQLSNFSLRLENLQEASGHLIMWEYGIVYHGDHESVKGLNSQHQRSLATGVYIKNGHNITLTPHTLDKSWSLRERPAASAANWTPSSKVWQLHPASGNEVIWESRDIFANYIHYSWLISPNGSKVIHIPMHACIQKYMPHEGFPHFSTPSWIDDWCLNSSNTDVPKPCFEVLMDLMVFQGFCVGLNISDSSWIKPRWSLQKFCRFRHAQHPKFRIFDWVSLI